MRQIALDTETTGLNANKGDRLVEIGCVELNGRSVTSEPSLSLQLYINPERDVPEEVVAVHGLTNEFLADKPVFADVVDRFLDFVNGAELIIHNASFDVGFLDMELSRLGKGKISDYCKITDSLKMAKRLFPGRQNNLDVLCGRFGIDNTRRTFHGALLDAQLLAEVYLGMTRGQETLVIDRFSSADNEKTLQALPAPEALKVLAANEAEIAAHEALLDTADKKCKSTCAWRKQPQITTNANPDQAS